VDLFEQRIPRIWLLTDERSSPRRDVIGLFNWDEKEEAEFSYPLARIGLSDAQQYVGFDYWADEFVEPFAGRLEAVLGPASCRILAVRPTASIPQVVSTSRHVAQAVVDVLAEEWDAATKRLCGVSRVVAADPYEIRIAARRQPGRWAAMRALVSQEDADAGVRIAILGQKGWKVRIEIDSPASRDVHWSVAFAAAP
jgi:hypothetical protein